MLDKITEKKWKKLISQFSLKPIKSTHKEILKELQPLVIGSIKKEIPKERFGILFSGGVDSTLIAKVCRDNKANFICYTSALEEKGLEPADDLIQAKKAAKQLKFKLKITKIGLDETENYIKKILKILKEPNVVKVGVALPLYLAMETAKKDNINIMFSGLGSEELFAGYERHEKAKNINQECFNGLMNMYERDIDRDQKISKELKITLKVPYLGKELTEYSLKIPSKFKMNKTHKKVILREVAENLKLGEFAWRKKKAAQYGSKFDRAIQKLAKRNGFEYKKDYLNSLLK